MDASDRKSVRHAEKASRLRDREAGEVVVNLCSTTVGRRWVWEQLTEAHIFATTFSPDPHLAAFNEGQRNAGLRLLAQVTQFCPQQIHVMMDEANVRDHTNDARRDNDRGGTDDDPGFDRGPDADPNTYTTG